MGFPPTAGSFPGPGQYGSFVGYQWHRKASLTGFVPTNRSVAGGVLPIVLAS